MSDNLIDFLQSDYVQAFQIREWLAKHRPDLNIEDVTRIALSIEMGCSKWKTSIYLPEFQDRRIGAAILDFKISEYGHELVYIPLTRLGI
jgi:hypothetical protein